MNDFIYKTWFYLQNIACWGYEKNPETKKIPRLVALPSPFYDMEADCFPVSENAENKPKWEGYLI